MDLREAERYYASIGFSRRTGFGERPALLVIDCNHGCSDPAVSSMAIAMDEEIRNIRRLLDLARAKQFPVVHTTVVYTEEHFRDGGWFVKKIPSLEALRDETDETSHLMVLVGRQVRIIASAESAQLLRVGSRAGTADGNQQRASGESAPELPLHHVLLGSCAVSTMCAPTGGTRRLC